MSLWLRLDRSSASRVAANSGTVSLLGDMLAGGGAGGGGVERERAASFDTRLLRSLSSTLVWGVLDARSSSASRRAPSEAAEERYLMLLAALDDTSTLSLAALPLAILPLAALSCPEALPSATALPTAP
jgi:hypothetical protein